MRYNAAGQGVVQSHPAPDTPGVCQHLGYRFAPRSLPTPGGVVISAVSYSRELRLSALCGTVTQTRAVLIDHNDSKTIGDVD